MNRAEVRNLVIETTGRSDKTTLINSAINIALNKLSSEYLWNDLLTEASANLTVGSNAVSLASNMRRLSEVRLLDGLNSHEIIVKRRTWIAEMFPDITAYAASRPRYAYVSGTTLYLVPAPDAVYNGIEYSYYRMHPDLTDDSTDILIPQADEAVIAFTTYWVFKSIEKHEDAAQWFAEYQMLVRDAKRVDRDSAVDSTATPRGQSQGYTRGNVVPGDYWLNPFYKGVP